MTSKQHKVFLSFHSADFQYKEIFENTYGEAAYKILSRFDLQTSNSSPLADTQETIRSKYLKDSSVTIVLIGPYTSQSKLVDWEIAASLKNGERNLRSGLIGIVLPHFSLFGSDAQTPQSMPERLAVNVENGYAKVYHWPENPEELAAWIDEAWQRRADKVPDNATPLLANHKLSFQKERKLNNWNMNKLNTNAMALGF